MARARKNALRFMGRQLGMAREAGALQDMLRGELSDPFGSAAAGAARGQLADTIRRVEESDSRQLAARGLAGGEMALAMGANRARLAGSSLRQLLLDAERRRRQALGILVGQQESALNREFQDKVAKRNARWGALGQAGSALAFAA